MNESVLSHSERGNSFRDSKASEEQGGRFPFGYSPTKKGVACSLINRIDVAHVLCGTNDTEADKAFSY